MVPQAQARDVADARPLCCPCADSARRRTQMTRLVLPGMKARKRGAIVNIGSAVATIAPLGPLYTVYAATKV